MFTWSYIFRPLLIIKIRISIIYYYSDYFRLLSYLMNSVSIIYSYRCPVRCIIRKQRGRRKSLFVECILLIDTFRAAYLICVLSNLLSLLLLIRTDFINDTDQLPRQPVHNFGNASWINWLKLGARLPRRLNG